ncbi:hypothetical protein B0H19DRAFT_1276630 [Mycena capillaripes]|nr:hypothetical protein B0H19DRAFT_1276630 [Mycena capillaripes]
MDGVSGYAYDPISNAAHHYKSEVHELPSPLHISQAQKSQTTRCAGCDGSSARLARVAVRDEKARSCLSPPPAAEEGRRATSALAYHLDSKDAHHAHQSSALALHLEVQIHGAATREAEAEVEGEPAAHDAFEARVCGSRAIAEACPEAVA